MKTVRSILTRVMSGDPAVRRAAATELSKLKSHSAVSALESCLDHRDPDVRRIAASGLAHAGDPSPLGSVLKASRLESDHKVLLSLWRAATRLARCGGKLSDVPRLAAWMADARFPDDAMGDACSAALHILAANAARLPEPLIGLLQAREVAEHPLIQTALQKAIATNAGQRLARALAPAYLDLLQDDSFHSWHPALIEALGDMREVRAIGTLLKRFESIPALQDKVLGALSLIGVENLDPVTTAAVRLHEEIYFRTPSEEEFETFFFESAQRLAAMGEKAVPVLMRLLDHPNGALRQNARYALESIKEPSGLMAMLKIAENRRDAAKTRLAWELVRKNHPDRSLQALAADRLADLA